MVRLVPLASGTEQDELLRSGGAEHVVSSSDAGFESSLRDLCERPGATIGFDAVAGEMSGTILRAQPRGSRLLVYGGLSFAPCQVDPSSLIFEGKRLEGFWLSKWLRSKSLLGQVRVSRHVQKLLGRDLKTEFQARIPLEDAAQGLRQYATNMTAGKVLLLAEIELRTREVEN
ncbi:MAG TPA: zinc-binding dehydrogenase [Terriglobales bacterium]|nr:zinc-binding dehydrogenase [Terriglobales bacterium]